METRHILAIVGVVSVFGWQNRVKLKSLASAAIVKSTPVLGNSKTAWAAAILALLTAFWPDISPHIPWPSPRPSPQNDTLAASYAADRVTQIAVLRELATQPFDGATDDGRRQAGEWFNAQRFRNRASDFGSYTDRVADAIAANSEDALASELEAK
jgi:hypothetical protein